MVHQNKNGNQQSHKRAPVKRERPFLKVTGNKIQIEKADVFIVDLLRHLLNWQ